MASADAALKGGKKTARKKILLFYPRLHANEIGEEADFPPLALMAAASMIDRNRFDVRIIDLRFEEDFFGPKGFAKQVLEDCLCVGISALSGHQIRNGLEVARRVREIAPTAKIVWGGWHPTLFAEQTASHPLVDVVVRGQGEITFKGLVERLEEGRPFSDLEGISFRENGAVRHNPDRPIADINGFPATPYDLVDLDRYLTASEAGGSTGDRRFIYYNSSVGCRHRCKFCVISLVFKRQWLALKPERVLDELEFLVKKHRIRTIYFADSEFFIDLGRVKEICRGIIERGLDIRWHALLRAEKLPKCDEETLQLIKRSGCDTLVVGVETGSQNVSRIINKDNKTEHAVATAKILARLGIAGHYAFVFGFPGERPEDVRASFDLIAKLKENDPNCLIPMYFYHPDPATPLYGEAEHPGYEPPADLEAWGEVDYNIKEAWAPWITPRFVDLVKRAVVFYIPAAFPAEITRGTLTHMKSRMQKGWKKYFYRALHRLARVRVKRHCYAFPLEWRIFNLLNRKKYR